MELPKKGYYRHFKGGRYELIDFATHSETMETMVVYRALYGEGGLWVRPLSMWSERVERDGRVYTRFLPEEEYLRLKAEENAGEELIPPPEEAPPEDWGSLPPPEGWEDAWRDASTAPSAVSASRAERFAGAENRSTPAEQTTLDAPLPGQISFDTLAAEGTEKEEPVPRAEAARSKSAGIEPARPMPAEAKTARPKSAKTEATRPKPAGAEVAASKPAIAETARPKPDGTEAARPTPAASEAARAPASDPKLELLKRVYGYDSFREGQAEVIDAILAGRDALAILPTGAGKSLCYQIPAQLLDGVAIVISPLISLMKDQVEALTQAGVAAAYLNSSLSERQFDAAMQWLSQGRYRVVYVAPERLLTPRFLGVMKWMDVSLVAVDEAHCISQWGQDFRPSYLEIPEFIRQLPKRPRLCAFTATATERVRGDVVRLLELRDPFVMLTSFDRPNLYFSVSRTRAKDEKLMELAESYRGFSGIVYCATRKGVEQVCEKLRRAGYPATRYHAGLGEAERQRNQEDFINDRAPIMVATNAFGMGIDKSDVRFVIHYNMPKDLESYYQEAGRAGRDGERADCHLLYEPRDAAIQRFFIDHMGEEAELDPATLAGVQDAARFRLNAMVNYCQTTQCLRRTILRYFGEERGERCDYCANCLNPQTRIDVTEWAMPLVECVKRSGGRFGVVLYIRALRGSRDKRVLDSVLSRMPQYGALKDVERQNLHYIVDALVEDGVLEITAGEYPLLRCGQNVNEFLSGERRVFAVQEEPKKEEAAKKSPKRREKLLDADVDRKLFDLLRGVRTKFARERGVPPYMICGDATLIDMCRKHPTDVASMREVYGMGDYKIATFGAEFIQAIRDYQG